MKELREIQETTDQNVITNTTKYYCWFGHTKTVEQLSFNAVKKNETLCPSDRQKIGLDMERFKMASKKGIPPTLTYSNKLDFNL